VLYTGDGLVCETYRVIDDRRWHRQNVPSARSLRTRPTRVEAMLWEVIRDRRLDGLKFRRQHPIGPFVVDFCCPELRLIVELDGAVHDTQREDDAEREALLIAAGYDVVRFRNDEVRKDLPSVLAAIRTAASQPRLHADHPLPRTGTLERS
jgi:very-short-patch-repair endonuclease